MNDSNGYIKLNNNILNKKFLLSVDDQYFKNMGGDILRGNVDAEIVCDNIINDAYHFSICSNGTVFTPCDICLDDVELRINIKNDIFVKLGNEDRDDGDVVFVNRDYPEINMKDIVYQLVSVSLPIRRVHEPGMCNTVMMNEFNKHQVARSDDEENDMNDHETSMENKQNDPRWDKLKEMLNK